MGMISGLALSSKHVMVDITLSSCCNNQAPYSAKPSALSQNPSQLLAHIRRCIRVIFSIQPRDHAQRLLGKGAGRDREYEVTS